MSDEAVRSAERIYRASNNPADGEAWIQAVLRTTGVPSTFLIAQVIQSRRAIEALIARPEHGAGQSQIQVLVAAAYRSVTPDDMVSFLRGGREWLTSGQTSFLENRNAIALVDAGVLPVSAMLCEHDNEAPNVCPCEPRCTCRRNGHTCSDVLAVHGMSDRECQFCELDALWVTKTFPGTYLCDSHLVSERARQFRVSSSTP